MKTALVLLRVALAVGLGACQCGGPLPAEDAGADASVPSDAGTDAGLDGGVDAGVDAGDAPDAGDAGLDSGDDAGADAGDDPGWDAVEDDGGQSLLDAGVETCSSCHGSAANAAPPCDTQGRTDATLSTIGAHQRTW